MDEAEEGAAGGAARRPRAAEMTDEAAGRGHAGQAAERRVRRARTAAEALPPRLRLPAWQRLRPERPAEPAEEGAVELAEPNQPRRSRNTGQAEDKDIE